MAKVRINEFTAAEVNNKVLELNQSLMESDQALKLANEVLTVEKTKIPAYLSFVNKDPLFALNQLQQIRNENVHLKNRLTTLTNSLIMLNDNLQRSKQIPYCETSLSSLCYDILRGQCCPGGPASSSSVSHRFTIPASATLS